MMAIEEFGNRQAIGNAGWSKLMTDLIYSGYVNDQIVEGLPPILSYREIAEGVEAMLLAKDPVLGAVYKCFEESQAGSQLMDDVKKKLMETVVPEAKKRQTKKPIGKK
ncbi:hypothetical protein G7074_18195 [Pedobacter sp. HDW13]|uniref:hypothetical protein n=1 Tax=Pedobacter sp. HDW13 TaxID=2714940 RepID=UPI001409E8DF|nr:hypothetical protein [Pedobacter sp. HDW13]QIL41026.1 hypothetical protein G7074_18195 [Pedobacter sp. HDW13]